MDDDSLNATRLNSTSIASTPFKSQPADTRPLVAVLVPSQEDWKGAMAMSMCQMLIWSQRVCKPIIANELGSSISWSRNALTRKAMQANADFMLFVDSDVVFPHDALERLLAHKKAIVGATYSRKRPPYLMLGELEDDTIKTGLSKAKALPAGFLLIDLKAMRNVPGPWWFESYEPDEKHPFKSEDIGFCELVRANGIEVWCDMDLSYEIGHFGATIVKLQKPAEPAKP